MISGVTICSQVPLVSDLAALIIVLPYRKSMGGLFSPLIPSQHRACIVGRWLYDTSMETLSPGSRGLGGSKDGAWPFNAGEPLPSAGLTGSGFGVSAACGRSLFDGCARPKSGSSGSLNARKIDAWSQPLLQCAVFFAGE